MWAMVEDSLYGKWKTEGKTGPPPQKKKTMNLRKQRISTKLAR